MLAFIDIDENDIKTFQSFYDSIKLKSFGRNKNLSHYKQYSLDRLYSI
jgi:hypothetical protein